MKFSRSIYVKAAAVALALAAVGTASVAEARSNVFFSIGVPGVAVGVSNGPVYYPPVYAAAPVYVQPAPAYYGYYPAPVYYGPPVVAASFVVGPRHFRHHPRRW